MNLIQEKEQQTKEKIEIKDKLEKDDLFKLADAYMASYNTLSKDYKKAEEMELYTREYFLRKLEKFRKGQKDSPVFVALANGKPVGFLRFGAVEDYYKNQENGIAEQKETVSVDGRTKTWTRKIKFINGAQIDNKTAILNQIYIDPKYQQHGIGEKLFNEAIPEMAKNYDDFIVEVNTDNIGAQKVYNKVLTAEKIADTKDFDHILKDGTDCISNVTIVKGRISDALERLKERKIALERSNQARKYINGGR